MREPPLLAVPDQQAAAGSTKPTEFRSAKAELDQRRVAIELGRQPPRMHPLWQLRVGKMEDATARTDSHFGETRTRDAAYLQAINTLLSEHVNVARGHAPKGAMPKQEVARGPRSTRAQMAVQQPLECRGVLEHLLVVARLQPRQPAPEVLGGRGSAVASVLRLGRWRPCVIIRRVELCAINLAQQAGKRRAQQVAEGRIGPAAQGAIFANEVPKRLWLEVEAIEAVDIATGVADARGHQPPHALQSCDVEQHPSVCREDPRCLCARGWCAVKFVHTRTLR
eukprot:4935177-Prymnesium_polylepis.1